MSAALVAYTPFIDPINLHVGWYWLLLPMALGVSITYKAIRVKNMRGYVKNVAIMTFQIIVSMLLLAIAAYLFVEIYVRWMQGA